MPAYHNRRSFSPPGRQNISECHEWRRSPIQDREWQRERAAEKFQTERRYTDSFRGDREELRRPRSVSHKRTPEDGKEESVFANLGNSVMSMFRNDDRAVNGRRLEPDSPQNARDGSDRLDRFEDEESLRDNGHPDKKRDSREELWLAWERQRSGKYQNHRQERSVPQEPRYYGRKRPSLPAEQRFYSREERSPARENRYYGSREERLPPWERRYYVQEERSIPKRYSYREIRTGPRGQRVRRHSSQSGPSYPADDRSRKLAPGFLSFMNSEIYEAPPQPHRDLQFQRLIEKDIVDGYAKEGEIIERRVFYEEARVNGRAPGDERDEKTRPSGPSTLEIWADNVVNVFGAFKRDLGLGSTEEGDKVVYEQSGTGPANVSSRTGEKKYKRREKVSVFRGSEFELAISGIKAAKDGEIDLVNEYLNCGLNPDTIDDNKMTMLTWAARTGDLELIKLLIEAGAEVDLAPTKESLTALVWAVTFGHLKVAKELVRQGADVNKEANLRTPLMFAVANGNAAITFFLLDQGADPKARSGQATSASPRNRKKNVKFGEAVEWEDLSDGVFPLQIAALYNEHIIIPLLIEFGASFRQVDEKGRRALHWAAAYGNLEALSVLSEYDLDYELPDETGNDALMWAIKNNHNEAARFLRRRMGLDFTKIRSVQ